MKRVLPLLALLLLLVGGGAVWLATRDEGENCGREADCGHEAIAPPESYAELALANSSRISPRVAPGSRLRPGAYRASIHERSALPTIGNDWAPVGGVLKGNRKEYDTTKQSTQEGFVDLGGRVTALSRDPATNRLFAAASNGGIWTSTDNGDNWRSIGDGLPTQVVADVQWSTADGGTLIVLTGDNAFGFDSDAGVGVYRSTDLGQHWTHSDGVPDGVLGFKLAVDPTNQQIVYAGTGGGLFRSTDAGQSFTNVNLPTGKTRPAGTPDCSGKAPTVKDCFLANMVTDVVVQGPANAKTQGGKPGAVLAAVGWRAGQKKNKDGSVQSPGNGIYRSDTGAPNTFTNLNMAANSQPNPPSGMDTLTQPQIGRVALGIANGANQDHRIVYAMVQDAVKLNGGAAGIDVEQTGQAAPHATILNALWVSTDFGATWKELEGGTALGNDTSSGSGLAPPVCNAPNVGYCPGIQSWYNLWVQPDPTQATSSGVPTRLVFGLEELWENDPQLTPPTGLDGSTSIKAKVFGRYYANACTPLVITNGAPLCPFAPADGYPTTTTHPDQHAYLLVPDGQGGGLTLFAGNDGGAYRQHVAQGADFSNKAWGDGANGGFHTLQPYDVAVARDGTMYMGLQDNGEAKIEPDGSTYTVFGGDGFFTTVEPDNHDHAVEEYAYGVASATKDGGKTWTDITPSNLTSAQFSTPLEMDPNDAQHLVMGGRDIEETDDGVDTTSSSWTKAYDLGTQQHPGDANASSTSTDPDNQLSAIDVRSDRSQASAPTGPHTADFTFTGGATTVPGGQDLGDCQVAPVSAADKQFTIGPNDGDARLNLDLTWADPTNDWDLFLCRVNADGSLTEVGSSADGNTTSGTAAEHISLANPPAGTYIARVVNFTAVGTFTLKGAFTQRTDPAAQQDYVYAAYCGFCDTIIQSTPFGRGIATNVGGSKPGAIGSGDGWHIAAAHGLPVRYIQSIRMDPNDPRTVYVTLGGYGRSWAFPGAVGEDTSKIGTGHVFKSTDAGETFTDITGNLPDTPANWSTVHNGHLVVGTDIGVFESCDTAGGSYSILGHGLPTSPISTLQFRPGDPDEMIAATYGRGIYRYHFGDDSGRCPEPPAGGGSTGGGGGGGGGGNGSGSGSAGCSFGTGLSSVTPRSSGLGLRLGFTRRLRKPVDIDVLQVSEGRRAFGERLVARFRSRTTAVRWNGKRTKGHRKPTDGIYVVRYTMHVARGVDDVRRSAFIRTHGRYRARPAMLHRTPCQLLRRAELSMPVFGGTANRRLFVSVLTLRTTRVTIALRSHGRTRRTVNVLARRGVKTLVRFGPAGLPRGDVQVNVLARDSRGRGAATLTARRL